MIYPFLPLIFVILFILINVLIMNSKNYKEIIILMLLNVIQMTPESCIGTYRLILSQYKLIKGNDNWIPTTYIDKKLKNLGVNRLSFYYFGSYYFIFNYSICI